MKMLPHLTGPAIDPIAGFFLAPVPGSYRFRTSTGAVHGDTQCLIDMNM